MPISSSGSNSQPFSSQTGIETKLDKSQTQKTKSETATESAQAKSDDGSSAKIRQELSSFSASSSKDFVDDSKKQITITSNERAENLSLERPSASDQQKRFANRSIEISSRIKSNSTLGASKKPSELEKLNARIDTNNYKGKRAESTMQ